ncbi:MAG: manganese-binding transcriptional regulator MntR [Planctomycetota bacterium]
MGSPASPQSKPFRRTRSDHASETAEDYVEAIAETLAERGVCRNADLARLFGVSHVTINKTVARLQREGLVETEPYGPLMLTASGRRLAEASRRRHEIVLKFLLSLGVSQAVAEVDSEGIEHHVSDETLAALERHLGDGPTA